MGKRILAGLLCVLFAVVLLPKAARAAGVIDVDLADGDVQILDDANSRFIVYQEIGGAFTNMGSGLSSDTQVRITSSAATTGCAIHVNVGNSSETLPVKITLNDVNANVPSGNALHIQSGTHVALTPVGDNTLKSAAPFAAVHVPVGAFLTIDGGGTLTAYCLSENANVCGAAIGGNGSASGDGEACGSVCVKGGTVFASGSGFGAGIGGGGSDSGTGGAGGNITIIGGMVVAGGGSSGAGIGGGGASLRNVNGNGGAGGTTVIRGGTVYAWDGGSTNHTKRGAAIGCGGCYGVGNVGAAAAVTVGTFAYEWLYLSHVSDQIPRNYSSSPWSGAGGNMSGYLVIRPPLTIRPASGAYDGSVPVTVTASLVGAEIWYTLDGSDPADPANSARRRYAGQFDVTPTVQGMQVKAYAEDRGPQHPIIQLNYTNCSAVVTARYSLGNVPVPQTGDETSLALPVALILLSAAGLAASAAVKRRAAKRR